MTDLNEEDYFNMSIAKGQIVEGVVSRITKFGAFVELPDGKTGLVHISEVADSYVKDVNDYLKNDEKVKVKVINIDESGKIGLSIRQTKPKPRPQRDFKRAPKQKQVSFEDKLSKFLKDSNERLACLNLKNESKRKKNFR